MECVSVRSRLYFKRAITEKDEEPDPDLRVLEVMKSNYGPIGETINLRWKNGLFLPVGGVTNLEKLAAEQAAEQLFLNVVDQFNRQGRNSSEPNAPTYAPTLFAKEKPARERGIKKAISRRRCATSSQPTKFGWNPTDHHREEHRDWRCKNDLSNSLSNSLSWSVVLLCYPLYPRAAAQGAAA